MWRGAGLWCLCKIAVCMVGVCRTHVHPDVSVYGVCLHGIPFRPVVSVFIGRMLGVLYGM